MVKDIEYEEAQKKLQKYGQEQVLNRYKYLSDEKKEKLINQIKNIDFDQIKELFDITQKSVKKIDGEVSSINFVDKSKLSKEEYEKYYDIGSRIIKDGKYAVVTMAGGQGTRLGYVAPKGTFKIGGGVDKSLFEALSDTIKDAKNKFDTTIPWYIMTSRENNDATEKFFEKNDFFGLPYEDIKFFKQGELPMLSTDGKLMLDEAGLIKLAADGHGGVFESLVKNGYLEDMKKRGIEWIFISGVDNVLAGLVDPIAVGLAVSDGNLATGKSVVKRSPDEKVGVFCKRNGRPYVIEYTEITDEMANAKNENGELIYGESHILTNLFNIKALENIAKNKLPYHKAFKKAKYMNDNGEIIAPEKPNAYKYEAFIFDAFESLDDMSVLRVKREDEFAPLKNADGEDSPNTARQLYIDYQERRRKGLVD
jgi:UDP-N-acetylglucosamine/UDP-N-acetylgalactosamine diphosphorylase